MGFFWESGEEPRWERISNYTPQQQRLLSQDISNSLRYGGGYRNAMSILEQYLNPQSSLYNTFEQPYLNQFYQQTIPNLAERFAGLNPMGSGLSSSGFAQSLSAAGSNLEAQLAAMKQGMQRQSINDLLGQYNQSIGRGLGAQPFTNVYNPGTQGQSGLGGSLLSAGATALGSALGGPVGGALGAGASSLISQLFS